MFMNVWLTIEKHDAIQLWTKDNKCSIFTLDNITVHLSWELQIQCLNRIE